MSHRKLEQALGLDENELKGILDAKQPRIPSVLKAQKIAEALGLEFYIGPPRALSPIAAADPDDFTPIPILEATLAAGGGALNEDEAVISHLAFRRDWLNRIGVSSGHAIIARAKGRNMEPTIHNGDMVLIDRGTNTVPTRPRDPADTRPARIHALRDDRGARVKRLELAAPVAAPGVLALMSDNPDHPPEFRQVSDVQILGRVVWWGHTDRG